MATPLINESASFEQVQSPLSEANKEIIERRNFHLHNVDAPATGPSFIFPTEVGVHHNIIPPLNALTDIYVRLRKPKHLLGEWPATALCGNDILSSVLYSAGLVALTAGKLAPIGLALVSLVLYLYRFIYEEVVTAIPMNGGSYNCLLNTTSKRFAAIAACLSILSYTATAVVSGTSASYYLQSQFPSLPVVGTTIGILGFFAVLVLFGISESSVIALCIFTAHVVTLTVLGIMSLVYTINHPHIFKDNYSTPFPDVDFSGSMIKGNWFTALFFGFSSAMLGVTGFESSSNFVEEQKPGVFRKTLRNMWAIASIYNIFLSFMSLGVLPLNTPDGLIANQGVALAQMGLVVGGSWLQLWVAIDAFVVLSGAVLTAYVGINGLLRRLSTDRVVPQFFAHENKWRKTNHWIIIVFFLLTSSLVWILNADNVILSGVYTYAFLSLMFLFGVGCMILKVKRTDIPRDIHAPWWSCICGCLLIFIGFLGTLLGNPKVLMYFAFYFLGILFVVFVMLERVTVLRTCIFIVNLLCNRQTTPKFEADEDEAPRLEAGALPKRSNVRFFEREGNNVAYLVGAIREIKNQPILFFIRTPNLTTMNKAILYVRNNEITDTLRFVHVYLDNSPASMAVVESLKEMVQLFDAIYPKLRTDLWTIQGTFDAGLVTWISEEYKIPTNMMFIKQPSASTTHKAASRGIRVITG